MRVETFWYVAAYSPEVLRPDVRFVTALERVYYDFAEGRWEVDSVFATAFLSRSEALTNAFMLAAIRPQYLGKLSVKRIRRVWNPCPNALSSSEAIGEG